MKMRNIISTLAALLFATSVFAQSATQISGTPQLATTFIGSGTTANLAFNQTGTAASATLPEIGGQFTLTSNTGFANPYSAYKIGLTSSVLGGASSSNVYGFNAITQGHAGAGGYLVTGMESDINNIGAAATTLGSNTAANGYVGVAAGSAASTSAFWATGPFTAAHWTYGFAADGYVDTAFFDDGTHVTGIKLAGSHTTGIDMSAGTFTNAIKFPDGTIQNTAATGGGGSSPLTPPQGRLTLATATPVMASNVLSATTIYYTPYVGAVVPLWNGSSFANTLCPEISNITTNAATGNAGPAAVAASSVYDLFVWNNGGTCTLTRGPAWTNSTTRSAGTALVSQNGILLNNAAITNGPAASTGTYIGTVISDASSKINWNLGTLASGTQAGCLGLWNQYNRVKVVSEPQDSTATWTYNGAAWRSANNSTQNRVTFVIGQSGQTVLGEYMVNVFQVPSSSGYIGTCIDCTNNGNSVVYSTNNIGTPQSKAAYSPSIGQHYIQAVEYAAGVTPAGYAGNSAQGLFVISEQ